MFRKREDIEQDFIAYGTSNTPAPASGGTLGKLIQFLSVVVLLGVVTLMGMFGYKYWQSEFASDQSAATPASPTVPPAQTTNTTQVIAKKPEEKLYTQEEMQAIVAMLIQQMQNQKNTPLPAGQVPAPAKKLTANTQTEPTQQLPADGEEDETDALIAALNDIEIEPLQLPQSPHDHNNTQRYTKTTAQQKSPVQQDNKVLLTPARNSYDNIANLSKEIGNIVESMQKKSTSNYTSAIKKEITTRTQEMRFIVVQKGDTLSKIAQRAYGNAMAFDIILEANPDLIKNPDHIYVGQRLRVPLVKK